MNSDIMGYGMDLHNLVSILLKKCYSFKNRCAVTNMGHICYKKYFTVFTAGTP